MAGFLFEASCAVVINLGHRVLCCCDCHQSGLPNLEIQPGAVGIEHGYGHTELGARAHAVDGKPMPHDPALAAGVNLNDLGFGDATRGEHANVWIVWVSGAAVRQGLPARIERV